MQKIDWNKVYRDQSGVLIGVAYRYVKERKQAEDLVQDALIAAIQKAGQFSSKGVFEAWLRRIVVNECLMFLRKAKIQTESWEDHLHSLPETAQMPDENEDLDYADDPNKRKVIERCNFSREDLLEIAAHLPEHHRLVFNMYVIDEFSHKEIAAQLNISEGTSKSHLNRARKKLQDLLYEKALDMQKKKKKQLFAAIWFSGLFGKASIVDAMHRKAFADFTLPAPLPSTGLEQAMLSAPATSVGLSATAAAIVVSSITIAGIVGTVGVVEWQKHRAESVETEIEYGIPEIEMQNEHIAEPDFSMPAGVQSAYPTPKQPDIQPIQEDTIIPVVIKKTIFDTIYEDDED